MGQVRALVTLQSVADVESVAALMKRVASYIEEHFGDRLAFEPFINEDTGRVVWLNAAADEDTLVEWEQAMRETVLPPSPGDRGRSGDRQDLALAGWGLRQPAGALTILSTAPAFGPRGRRGPLPTDRRIDRRCRRGSMPSASRPAIVASFHGTPSRSRGIPLRAPD